MNQLTGDGVTKNFPSIALMEIAELTKTRSKNIAHMKVASARPAIPRKPHTALVYSRKSNVATPREIISREVKANLTSAKKTTKLNKKESAPTKIPTSAQTPNRRDPKIVDYRLITSPTLRRKAYSATITPKTNRPRSPAEGASRPTSPKMDRVLPIEKDSKETGNRKTYDMHIPDRMHFQEINDVRKVISAKSRIKINIDAKPQ